MNALKKKLIQCLINSNLKLSSVKAKEGYKVKVVINKKFEVEDVTIETMPFVESGIQLLSPSNKRKFANKRGVIASENCVTHLLFYTNSSGEKEAITDILSYIKSDYDYSVATHKKTKSPKYALEANALVNLYTSLKSVTDKKGVA